MKEELAKLASTFKQDDMIKIALEDGGEFTVQKAILRNASAYFAKALENDFKESKDKRLRLPGCTTAMFEVLLYWLCKSKLPDYASYLDSSPAPQPYEDECIDVQSRLVRLWALADMWMMSALQNHAMQALNKVLKERIVEPIAVKTALELLPSDALICKALLRDFAYSWRGNTSLINRKGIEELGQMPGFFTAFSREMFSNKGTDHGKRMTLSQSGIEEFLVPKAGQSDSAPT